ncbi:hypothetical protein EDB86DRAFT_3211706 [Lactarius hatsudake]|nr:hypothetical protein EDB86DRAFT_3211706 [Lactarius hatsudake]
MPGESAISLRSERDNPCNTTIFRKSRDARTWTVSENLVAEWIWGDARSDLLTIGGRPQTRASAWLKKSFIPFRDDVKFLDDAGTEYTWQNNKPGLALQLFGPQSKTLPVARFIRTYKDYKADREKPTCGAFDAPT